MSITGRSTNIQIALAFLLAAHLGSAVAQDNVLSKKSLIEAWSQRPVSYYSIDLIADGTNYIYQPSGESGSTPGENVITSDGISHPVKMRLVLDNRIDKSLRYYLLSESQVWSSGQNAFTPHAYELVVDGDSCKSYHTKGRLGYPVLFISGAAGSSELADLELTLPILLYFRPFSDLIGPVRKDSLSLLGEQAKYLEKDCEVFQLTTKAYEQSDCIEKVWVIPQYDYSIAKYLVFCDGSLNFQIHYTYGEHPESDGRWLPSGWTIYHFDDSGRVESVLKFAATYQALNKPIADDLFIVNPLPGTWINDGIAQEEYILRKDGSKRHVLAGELDVATYEEILNSEPGELTQPKRISSLTWALLVGSALLVLFVLHQLYRRRRPQ